MLPRSELLAGVISHSTSEPADPLERARSIIARTDGLDDAEKAKVIASFEARLESLGAHFERDKGVKAYLSIFAGRAAQEAVIAKRMSQSSPASEAVVSVATNGQSADVSAPPKRRVPWHLGSKKGGAQARR